MNRDDEEAPQYSDPEDSDVEEAPVYQTSSLSALDQCCDIIHRFMLIVFTNIK